ncbi:MAG: 16S rRNA (cytosine(1402)-N(4))-methyltransferase RsmH [Parcubacteria group bacterium]
MTIHKSVLLKESIEGLNLKEGSVAVDATLGGGGHSSEILTIIGKEGKLIVIDQDSQAIDAFRKRLLDENGNVIMVKDNFVNLQNILEELEIGKVDAILADLGYSSIQLEDPAVGMSFLQDAPLDMRLDREGGLTAKMVVNGYTQGEIARILKNYGEERFAGIIAKRIADRRKTKPIETTRELVGIINDAIPERFHHGKIHPATKTFQALRIETNKELDVLEKFIPQAIDALKIGGRLAIIAFHSLEDRIVKNIYRENARGCICPPDFPVCQCGQKAKIRIITKKPVIPTEDEIGANPRSRSAKLRVCEKIQG